MPKSAFLVNVRPETASRSLNALLRLTSQSFDLLLLVVIGLLLLHCVHAEKTASSPFCVPGKNNIVDKDSLVLENNLSADLEIRDVEPDLATYNRLTEQYRQVFLDGKKVIINHQIQISSSLKLLFKSSCSIRIPRRAQYVSFLSVWIEKVSVEHMKLSDAQGLPLAESISFHSDHLNAIMTPAFFFHDENRFDYAPLLFVTIGSKHRRVEIPRAGIYYNYQDRTFETYIELGREASATAMQINPWSSVTPQSGDALHDWLGQLMSGTLPVLDGYEAEDKQAELKSLGWFIISCEEIVNVPSGLQRGEFTPARDHVAISVSHGHKIALQYESILPKQNVLIFSTGNIMNCKWKRHNSNMMLIVLHEIDSNHKIILTSYAPIMGFHEPLSKPYGTHFRWKTQCFGSVSRAFQLHPDTRKILMTITSPMTDAIYIDPILVLYEGSPFPFWAIIVIIVAGSLVLTLLGAVLWRCCCNRPGSEQTESPNHGFTELAVCSSTV